MFQCNICFLFDLFLENDQFSVGVFSHEGALPNIPPENL